MSVTTCHVCGNTILETWCPGLLECSQCTHVQANMQLTPEDLASLYDSNYFHGDEYVDYELEREALDLNFTHRLRQIRKDFPGQANLYEIGCAYGFFLSRAKEYYRVSGCDLSEHAINEARKNSDLDVQCADYLTLPEPALPFDIICLWDTIEHIANPKAYIEKAAREISDRGCMIISTGDAGSRVARFRRGKWRMVHPPTHLHYFTSKSMRTMLSNAGFKKVEITHEPFYRNLGSSLDKIQQLSQNPLVKIATQTGNKIPGIQNINLPLNLFDIMTVRAWL